MLLELYMSGELSYMLGKIAELGMVEQSRLHSRTSQYRSMSRGMRFRLPELRATMREGLDEIRGGEFAREWAAEQEQGSPTLEVLRESARSLPLYRLERELRQALGDVPSPRLVRPRQTRAQPPAPARAGETGAIGRAAAVLGRLMGRLGRGRKPEAQAPSGAPTEAQMQDVVRAFIAHAARDPAVRAFASGQQVTTHYVLTNRGRGLEFYMRFEDGLVTGGLGSPPAPAEVRLEMEADVLDGVFTGRVNAARAAMSGKISFGGDTRQALGIQRIQKDLNRLYNLARTEVMAREA